MPAVHYPHKAIERFVSEIDAAKNGDPAFYKKHRVLLLADLAATTKAQDAFIADIKERSNALGARIDFEVARLRSKGVELPVREPRVDEVIYGDPENDDVIYFAPEPAI